MVTFSRSLPPTRASSKTPRCCIAAGSDMGRGRASSLTAAGPPAQPLNNRPAPPGGEGVEQAVQIVCRGPA
jgi:hypothetical protein